MICIELQTYSRIQSRSPYSKTPCRLPGELHELTPNLSKGMSKGEMDSQLLPELFSSELVTVCFCPAGYKRQDTND